MSTTLKQHDMMLAILNKPDASAMDFMASNMTGDNTLLLPADEYKKYNYIQQQFTDKEGKFSEDAFNKFYNLAQANFIALQEDLILDNVAEDLEYGATSLFAPAHRRITPTIEGVHFKNNPLNQKIGIDGNYKSDAEITAKEAAQLNRIWDPVNRKWLNETAEGRNLLQKAFGEPLAYARYTQDTTINPVTGEHGNFRKGDFILDENGLYFTQLAGSLDLAEGHEIVKLQDILTKETSALNKLDFFDADGLYKSPVGVATKMLLSVAPYFLGPYFKIPYTILNIIVGLGSTLPSFVKAGSGIFSNQRYSELSESCNQIINYFERFKPSISDAGAKNFMSFENLGMMAVDTVNQLYGQRGIASLSKYMTKVPKAGETMESLAKHVAALKKMSKRSQALSAAYMTLLSVGDVYNQAIQAGYDDRTAGIATLLSAASMYGMVRFNAMSSWMLGPEQGYTKGVTLKMAHTAAKDKFKALYDASQDFVQNGGSTQTKAKLAGALNGLSKFWDESIRVGLGGLGRNMFTEGVEEVTEEVAIDGVKGLIDGLRALGFAFDSNTQASFGDWGNVFSQKGLERYLQTFIGGAIGGGLFHTIDTKIDPKLNQFWTGKPDSRLNDDAKADLIDIYFSGDIDGYIKELKHVAKYLPDLLMMVPDENGQLLSTSNKEISMREFVLSKLIEEAQITKANMDEYMRTVNPELDKYPDIKAFIEEKFKSDIRSTELGKFYEERYKWKVKQLFEYKKVYEDYVKIYQTAPDETKAETKEKMELAKSRYEDALSLMKRYFEGKSHADTYRIGQFLLSPEVVNFLKPNRKNLSIEAFYKNFYVKGTPTTEYENLTPNAKERVKDAYDALVNEGSDLKNVLIQADVLLETVDVISDIIAPSITNFLRHSRNKVLTDHIHKDIKTLQDALEAIDYESILSGEIANWDSLDDLSKFTEIQKAKILALTQATTPDKILQMIQASPETMGSMEKFQIDYAGAVAKYLPGYDKLKSETKKVIDNLINSVLAQHSVVAFTESQMSLLLTDIITKITEDPIWKSAIEQALFGDEQVPAEGLGLGIFDAGTHAKIAAELNKAKQRAWMDLSKNGGLLDGFYDDIIAYKEKIIELFKEQLEKSEANIKEVFTVNAVDGVSTILVNLDSLGMLLVITKPGGALAETTAPADLQKLLKLIGVTLSDKTTTQDVIDAIETLNERPDPSTRVDNTLRNAITQLCLAAGVEGNKAITMASFLNETLNKIREGKASISSISSLPEHLADSLREMETVLQMILAVGRMMAPIRYKKMERVGSQNVEREVEIDGINQVRRDYFLSIGENVDKIHTMSYDEYLFFSSIIEQLQHLISIIKNIHNKAKSIQQEQFEDVRTKMFRHNYALVKALNSIGIQSGEDDKLFTFSNDVLPLLDEATATVDDMSTWTLKYKSLLQQRFAEILDKGNFEEYGITAEEGETIHNAIVRHIVDKVTPLVCGDNEQLALTLYQYESDAITASGGEAAIVSISDMQLGYVLTDILSVIPNAEKPSGVTVRQIHEAIEEALKQNPKFYPRQDQLYNIELALLCKFNHESMNALSAYIASTGAGNPDVNLRRHLYNYIRIPGPAGSGKSALWTLYIDALKILDPKIKIAGTAHAERKVNDLEKQINSEDRDKSKHIPFSLLQQRVAQLEIYQDLYKQAESDLLSDLSILGLAASQPNQPVTIDIPVGKLPTEIKDAKGTWSENDGVLQGTITLSTPTSDETSSESITVTLSIREKDGVYSLKSDLVRYSVDSATIDKLVLNTKHDDIENGVLLLDECTNLNTLDAQILDLLALKHNVLILATGDGKQEGYVIHYTETNKKTNGDGTETITLVPRVHSVGDDDFIGINLPSLKSIHRAHNTGQEYNWEAYRKVIDDAVAKSTKDQGGSFQGLANYTITQEANKELKDRANATTLKFTTQDSEFGFLGTRATAEDSVFKQSLDSIKDASKRTVIGIISNKADEGTLRQLLRDKGFADNNITIELVDAIKGVEADYAVGYNISPSGDPFQQVTRFYTLMTRGKSGYIGLHVGNWEIGYNSQESKIYTVNTLRSANDLGVEYLERYSLIVKQLPEITLPTENLDEVVTDTDDTQVDEEPVPAEVVQAEINAILAETSPEVTTVDEIKTLSPDTEKANQQKESIRKENTRIETAFGNNTVLPMHPMGFRTGVKAETLLTLKGKTIDAAYKLLKTADRNTSNENGDMWAIAEMLQTGVMPPLLIANDQAVIKKIIEDAKARYNKNFIFAYVYVINALRDAVYNGEIKRVVFWKTTYNAAFDHAFLKPNDDETKSDAIYRFGIPTSDSPNTMITLGTGGFIEYNGENKDEKGENRDSLWTGTFNVYQLKDDITTTDDGFNAYFDSPGESGNDKAQGSFYVRDMRGGARPLTSSRPLIPNADIAKNRADDDNNPTVSRNGVVFLRPGETRPLIDAILESGWELVSDPANPRQLLKFEVDPSSENLVEKFTEFVNKHRKAALTSKQVEEKFSGILSHSGVYYVVRPIGRKGCTAFMYVNQCIDWDAWASSHAFYGKRRNTSMSKYATFQLLAALSDSSINTWKYDVVDAKFLQSLENKSLEEILNEIRSRIENSDLWKNKVLVALGNDVDDDFKAKLLNSAINAILKTQYPFTIKGIGKKQLFEQKTASASIKKATEESAKNRLKISNSGLNPLMKDRKFILKTLAKNKPNYIFTSIVSPDTQVSLYCGYLYEQERVLIDLDAYEKVLGGLTASETQGEEKPKVSEITVDQEKLMGRLFLISKNRFGATTAQCNISTLQTLTEKEVEVLDTALKNMLEKEQLLYIKALKGVVNQVANTNLRDKLEKLC